jgi:hypothetical protein
MVRDAVHRVGVVVGVGQIATWDLSRIHKPVERRLLARTFIVPPSVVCVCVNERERETTLRTRSRYVPNEKAKTAISTGMGSSMPDEP